MECYYVYVLRSLKDKNLYVECTKDVLKRLKLHDKGLVPATKYRRPLELIHVEELKNKSVAFNRERFLKSLWGAREKKRILKKYLDGL
jgi:predicted GIY-YIG superfamily endonuclease